ncbi:MAG: site-specific integrase [Nocardioidaceae bacterium]|nr:site-specific integrase [Nocardioidaceae bacterium]
MLLHGRRVVLHRPGRWRARYTGPDSLRRSASFRTKADARAWLSTAHADVVRRAWWAPEAGRRTVGAWAADYLVRTDLRESTRALYTGLWTRHLSPVWEQMTVADVSAQHVRSWHDHAAASTGPTVLAQSYRLLRSLLQVAVADEVIAANPCRLRGAGTPKPARPTRALTAAEVHALAAAVPACYSALILILILILVLAFGGLRFGEATALRCGDLTPGGAVLTVERSVGTSTAAGTSGHPRPTPAGAPSPSPTSSRPRSLSTLDAHVPAGDEAVVFGTRTGNYLARSNFALTFRRAVHRCGLPPVRVHELRYTGATLAAATGASTAELMRRLGHSPPMPRWSTNTPPPTAIPRLPEPSPTSPPADVADPVVSGP